MKNSWKYRTIITLSALCLFSAASANSEDTSRLNSRVAQAVSSGNLKNVAAQATAVDQQVTNAITQSNVKVLGTAPSQSMGNIYLNSSEQTEGSLSQESMLSPDQANPALNQIDGGPPY